LATLLLVTSAYFYVQREPFTDRLFSINLEDSIQMTERVQINISTPESVEFCFEGPESRQKNLTELIFDIGSDPCYRDRKKFLALGSNSARVCSCAAKHSKYSSQVSYLIPPLPAQARPLTVKELENKTIFGFIHLNKAGGTTIKREILLKAAKRNKWDAAAIGSYGGWNGLGTSWPSQIDKGKLAISADDALKRSQEQEPSYVQCGRPVKSKSLLYPFGKMNACRFRAFWGAMSLGLCQHFPHQPCIYFIVLRDPIARAISSYNYVCIKGAEHKKKWLPEWKKAGRCPLSLLEFFGDFALSKNSTRLNNKNNHASLAHVIGTPNKLVERLSKGCDTACGLDIALRNLQHPCVRFLFLDTFKDGLEKMFLNFGPSLSVEIEALMGSHNKRNKSPYPASVIEQINNPEVISRLRAILAQDIELYNEAKRVYETQWSKPLLSCNQHLE